MSRADFVARILTRMAAGQLPAKPCERTWAGRGTDRACDVCGRPITPSEIECEADFANDTVLRFHLTCYELWEEARVRSERG